MYTALIGTTKGLIVYAISQERTFIKDVHFKGFSINLVYINEITDRWWVGVSHKHWGQKLHFSDNEGKDWQIAKVPSFEGAKQPDGKPARLRQIWCMSHGGKNKPGELWLGTDPGGLFHSKDNGKSFKLVRSLWDHPSRQKPDQWFGAGSDYPFIHSIVVDPTDNDHIYIAVSCAGVFETRDGGYTWHPKNKGLIAAYLPNPYVEIGHDPHALLMHYKNPEIMWQQNHCGVFYTENGGEIWHDVSGKNKLPYYGFSIAIDEENPEKAWVIPVESDEQRVAPDLKLKVYRTSDFGASWQALEHGLPKTHAFDIVLRQSFAKREKLLLFGTTNGNLYHSFDEGCHWSNFESNLTKVNSVLIK